MIRVRNVPVYWAVETDPQDHATFTGSWFVEDSIPFRASTYGVRIRVSHRHWLHVGLFRYRREALHLGLSYRPTEIGKWGKDVEAQTERSLDEANKQADQVAFIGSGASAGVIPQPDGRVVSWTITSGTGPGLAAEGDGGPGQTSPGGDTSVTGPG